jgi:FixJ family two-component response regulator
VNGGEIVFVVDDEASVRTAVRRLMGAAGFRTEAFGSARQFLARSRHEGAACLVLDVQMPEMDGLELVAELRRIGYALPIVFISAHADALKRARAINGGWHEFILKPFDDQQLLTAVASALDESRRLHLQKENPQA